MCKDRVSLPPATRPADLGDCPPPAAPSRAAEERAEVLEAEVVVAGLAGGSEVYLLAEVSGTITAHDVRRARAVALERATGLPVLPAVAGERLSDDPQTREEAVGVWRVVDGRAWPPSEAGLWAGASES